jgi:hypothetical protein
MRRHLPTLLCLVVLGMSACGRAASAPKLGPEEADAATQTVDLRSHNGQSFADFVAAPGMDRFSLDKLDLSADERARLRRVMVHKQPSRLVTGGGAEALLFTGCADAGCDTGEAVLAVGDHGEAFVGVRDGAGTELLAPNDRIEALLRLNSPSRRWDDVAAASASTGTGQP